MGRNNRPEMGVNMQRSMDSLHIKALAEQYAIEQERETNAPKSRIEEMKAMLEQRRMEKAKQLDLTPTGSVKTIPKKLIRMSEEYIVAQGKKSEAESVMNRHKPEIKDFMNVNGVQFIHTDKGTLELEVRPRPIISSKYMTYLPSDIEDYIPEEYKKLIFETVVNSEILEELVNAGVISSQVLKHRYTEDKDYLLVKHNRGGKQ